MEARGVLEPLEVEAGHQRELLHGELLGGLLVGLTDGAADLGSRAEVLGAGESLQAVLQRDRVSGGISRVAMAASTSQLARGQPSGRQVQGYVPEGVNGGGDVLAVLTYDVRLQLAGEDRVDDAVAGGQVDLGAVD